MDDRHDGRLEPLMGRLRHERHEWAISILCCTWPSPSDPGRLFYRRFKFLSSWHTGLDESGTFRAVLGLCCGCSGSLTPKWDMRYGRMSASLPKGKGNPATTRAAKTSFRVAGRKEAWCLVRNGLAARLIPSFTSEWQAYLNEQALHRPAHRSELCSGGMNMTNHPRPSVGNGG